MSKRLKEPSLFWVNLFTGIPDGLVLSFVGCILAFPFFAMQTEYVATMGLLVSIVGSIVFGLARYFGELSEIQHHHPRLSQEESVKEQALLQHIGIDPVLSRDMELEIDKEKQQWLDEMQENELGWEDLDKLRASRGAFQTSLGFLGAGLLIQMPVRLFLQNLVAYPGLSLAELLPYCFIPLVALFVFGGWKTAYTGRGFIQGGLYAFTYGFFTFAFALLIAWLLLHRK